MRRYLSATLAILMATSVLLADEDVRVKVAALDLEMAGGVSESYRITLSDRLRKELFGTGSYIVIERNAMESILSEQGLQLAGCTTDECAVEAGRLLGVEMMIAGSIGKVGNVHTISLRQIDVESGAVVRAESVDCACPIEEVLTERLRDAAFLISGLDVEVPKLPEAEPEAAEPPDTLHGPLPGMVFKRIPEGWFVMGSEDGQPDEKPAHRVRVSSFYMMTTEVTQTQWIEVMGTNPSKFNGRDHPVERVTAVDAEAFISWLNTIDPGKGYRLPTEAEWEYACRAGTNTAYYFGAHPWTLGSHAWFKENSSGKTHPVGLLQLNGWGLYDMHGNVYELCMDEYKKNYRGAPPDAAPRGTGKIRVIRGGSHANSAALCRSAVRHKQNEDIGRDYTGFRLVRSRP